MMSVDQISGVIQKWRDTSDGSWQPEDHKLFWELGSSCLAQGDSAELLSFVQDENNQEIIRSLGSNLVAPLTNEMLKKEKSLVHCQEAMTQLTTTCSPNDLLGEMLKVIDHVDAAVIADTITALAPHLQTVLLQPGQGRAASLGLALSSMQEQLSKLPVPYTQQLEESDQYGLCRSCTSLTRWVKPFVEEARGGRSMDPGDKALKNELLKFCMRSMREPLLQAQLHHSRRSALWFFAAEIMEILVALQEPLAELVLYVPLKRVLATDREATESRASLAYLLFVQLVGIEHFPTVFSPTFILQCNMEHVNVLLSRKDESYVLKGLELFAKSLEGVEDGILPVDLLEVKMFYSALQNLRQILTDCPSQHLRQKGLKVFQRFMNKLGPEAKHRFYRCMLKTSHHAGLEGYIIKNIKNQVELSMKPGNQNDWFTGAEFVHLLEQALCLPQGAETYLLLSMDRVMEALNLLRYLLLRGRDWKNNLSVWTELCRIKDNYLRMLRVCVAMSRSYYLSEVKELREDYKRKATEARAAARTTQLVKSLTGKQNKTSAMTPEVHHQVLQSALVTFDLMESLIVRIEEITEENGKSLISSQR